MAGPGIMLARALAKLTALFGRGLVVSIAVIVAVSLALALAVSLFVNSATPAAITIASGPKGSFFQKTAEKYREILAKEGVKVTILPSQGALDNLRKLADPRLEVDVGFVLGGELDGMKTDRLMSLGSVSYQPLMIFYRGAPKTLLSDFKGRRLEIGEPGSGTHMLALALLKLNGIEPGADTVLLDSLKGDSVRALLENRIDAIFVMGDSTSTDLMRQLLHTPDIHLFSFAQADGYVRRVSYLSKLELPRGALDFGRDIPPQATNLVGPTVELLARDSLHPALSDLLLDAARQVHGKAGIFKKRGEFPSPTEHEIPLSPDASRYYTSGKSFLYRTFPFWLAGLVARVLALIVPFALFLIPALKMAPAIYRWRVESSIHRWYRVLLDLESEAAKHADDPKRQREFLRHLDHIENTVSKIVVPAAFGDLLYGLRGHIDFVRDRLLARPHEEHAPAPDGR
ncbi:TAXI family TRAP transporter solute-binding subunit [Paludibacterium yongneupense]|uniref:TAXI family TRAP transporter solute-binding subunit n=1 Tax=Paludibacterium yongneupense TaxID=400061 RepID=UPI000409B8AC|nr:TAXI family TRAP transporter solute-binding subunit [Paludibacterium yongneupense]